MPNNILGASQADRVDKQDYLLKNSTFCQLVLNYPLKLPLTPKVCLEMQNKSSHLQESL